MKKNLVAFAFTILLLVPGLVAAQDAPAAEPAAQPPVEVAQADPSAAPTGEPEAAAPAPEATAAEPDALAPEAAELPAAEPEVAAEEEIESALEEAAEAEEESDSGLSLSGFVDAHLTLQSSEVGHGIPGHRAYAGASPGEDRASGEPGYVTDEGFALNFMGIDAAYDQPAYGATISLRFGPKMRNYHFNSEPGLFGIENVTQGYVTWRPAEKVSLDLGMFGTIFGAEVLESWQNLNYTRGALYFFAQPFWHTGLRASVDVTDTISLTGLIVNDANTSWNTDNPDANGPSLALQLGVSPIEMLSIAVGGMVATSDATDSSLETFFDLVATLTVDNFTAILNADYNINRGDGDGDLEGDEDASVLGGSLALGYQFTPMFGAAVRGEYLTTTDDNVDPMTMEPLGDGEDLLTATATLDLKPIEGSSNLIIRLDGRLESQTGGFVDGDGEASDTWTSITLGAVVTTD
ncbi:MAG: porin [Myxococcales bacterium]|nr:porin [Myxococcales bacterium]